MKIALTTEVILMRGNIERHRQWGFVTTNVDVKDDMINYCPCRKEGKFIAKPWSLTELWNVGECVKALLYTAGGSVWGCGDLQTCANVLLLQCPVILYILFVIMSTTYSYKEVNHPWWWYSDLIITLYICIAVLLWLTNGVEIMTGFGLRFKIKNRIFVKIFV